MTPCPTCGQPLPDQPRLDPPLAPLEVPNVVTIHDLPEGAVAIVEIEEYSRGRRVLRLKEGGDGAEKRP